WPWRECRQCQCRWQGKARSRGHRLGRRWLKARLDRLAPPADEALDGLVLRQAELVVKLGGRAVAVFGPLPELALVRSGEKGLVLLRLVLEDSVSLAFEFIRRERHRHL